MGKALPAERAANVKNAFNIHHGKILFSCGRKGLLTIVRVSYFPHYKRHPKTQGKPQIDEKAGAPQILNSGKEKVKILIVNK